MTTALVLFVVVLVVVVMLGVTLGMLIAGPLDRFTNAVRTPPKADPDDAPPAPATAADAPDEPESRDKETAP